jgi:DNA-binding response OmpR family regulator
MGHTPATLTSPTTVLVADDDDDLRGLIAETLRCDGYTVVEVRDGCEALDYLTYSLDIPALRPDIMLTDVRMPHLSGLGVLEALQMADVVVPTVVMTMLEDESLRIIAKRLGAVGVLHKPFDVDDLRTALLNAERACEATCARQVTRRFQ